MELENDQDIYIKCANGIRIYYYGKGTLEVYIPSLGRGHNIIKKIALQNGINPDDYMDERISENGTKTYSQNYHKLYAKVGSDTHIFDIIDTDVEIYFKIKDKYADEITILLQPQISGASISPFSSKNLPKNSSDKYVLSSAQVEEYKKITDKVPKEDKLKVGQITNRFIVDIMCKKLGYDLRFDAKPEMKKLMIKGKEYINYKGFWNEYVEYLKNELT